LDFGILTVLTFLPLLGALVVALLPRGAGSLLRGATLIVSLANLGLSLGIMAVAPDGSFSFVENRPWIESCGISY